jgi:muconolactone delta-isomerase
MTHTPPPSDTNAPEPRDDTARWQAAEQLRSQHPGWVIIWLARIGQYRAYPLFRAPRGTMLTAPTPDQMAAQMVHAEQAARRSRARSRDMDKAT